MGLRQLPQQQLGVPITAGNANGVSVTIKGGVKLTTLEILDSNLKREEWTGECQVGEYQKFGNMAGMKGDHVFGLVLHRGERTLWAVAERLMICGNLHDDGHAPELLES
jgi:hypothetical protein